MRVPLSWLRDFAPFEAPPAELAAALDGLGLVVEDLVEVGVEVTGVVVVRVLAVRPHPGADRLSLVDVDRGDATVEVVCGATNLAPGDVVPYAPVGASLAGGLRIERRKIRGVVSEGMLCSARELGVGEDHEGILHLPDGMEPGDDPAEVLGLGEVVFDVDVTPNRPDAMCVAGVARDLAAVLGLPFVLPEPAAGTLGGPLPGEPSTLVVEAPDRCPRYVARIGRVRMGPSPAWLSRRLTLAGLRPISNVVDVTNYVLLERGQPLHAFDLAHLPGRGIVVRLARPGETLVTLDEVERSLGPEDLLICDAHGVPQAIAGVMGGGASEVRHDTGEILLEAAWFEPTGIGRTSKRLGLRTEASVRFERGVDPAGVDLGARRAWELLAACASGQEAPGSLESYPTPVVPRRLRLRTTRVNALLGTALSPEDVEGRLRPLGIDVSRGDAAVAGDGAEGAGVAAEVDGELEAVVPTFRPDLEREVDLVEEVARHHGYNRIARSLPRPSEPTGGLTPAQRERRLVADALVGAGFSEASTLSLLAPADLTAAGWTATGIEVENPLRAEESLLRPSLLPGLLGAVATNAERGQDSVALFETGRVFLTPPAGQVLPDEREHVAAVVAGRLGRPPHEAVRPVDPHDAVGALEVLADALRLADWRLEPAAPPGFHPGRAATVVVDGAPVGVVGEIAPEVVEALRLPGPVAAFEVSADRLLAAGRTELRYRPLSRYPVASVDLAFVLDEGVPAGEVATILRRTGGPLVEDVRLFDVFRSEAIGAGRRSLAFRLHYRAPDRTLTDEEVGQLRQAGIDAVALAHRGVLRG